MKTRKILSLVLVCVLMLSLLCGCGKEEVIQSTVDYGEEFAETNGLKLPLTDKPVTVTIMVSSTMTNLNESLAVKTLKEVTGVDVKIEAVSPTGYEQKLQMLMASKKLPDIFDCALSRKDLLTLAENKAIVNFSENADILPNIKANYLDDESILVQCKPQMIGSDLFLVPSYKSSRTINHGFMFRKDIFEKNGIKPWTNEAEFIAALRKLKEIYPDSTPFVTKRKTNTVADFASGWGIRAEVQKDESGKYIYTPVTDTYRKVLDYIRTMYQEGLFDPEFLTATETSWAAKMAQNETAFVTFDWVDRVDLFYDQVKTQNPSYKLEFGYPVGPNPQYDHLSETGNCQLAVSNNDRAEVAMKLLDFLTSPAGAKLMSLGVEGTSYEVKDEKVSYIGMDESATPTIAQLEEKYGLFVQGLSPRFDRSSVYFQYSPGVQAAQELVTEKNLIAEPLDIAVIDKDGGTYNSILADLTTKLELYMTKYIMDKDANTDTLWNEWKAEAEKIGVAELEKIANNQ